MRLNYCDTQIACVAIILNNYWMRSSRIWGIIKAEVCVICRRLRQITQTEALLRFAFKLAACGFKTYVLRFKTYVCRFKTYVCRFKTYGFATWHVMFGRWNWHVFVLETECLAFIYYIYYTREMRSIMGRARAGYDGINSA